MTLLPKVSPPPGADSVPVPPRFKSELPLSTRHHRLCVPGLTEEGRAADYGLAGVGSRIRSIKAIHTSVAASTERP